MTDFDFARHAMVAEQIASRGLRNARVLDAMRRVPRHAFVPKAIEEWAYTDSPLPIGEDQTISQPYIVALMADAAHLGAGHRVLEIGTGSGYGAAILAEIAARVDTIERLRTLADHARRVLAELGYTNIEVHHRDGTLGLPERAPFDAIVATAGGPRVPDIWRTQLAIGGRIVMPIGPDRDMQRLVRVVRTSERQFDTEDLCAVQFVPLIGEHGWQS
jgi:protein-L-isoaspartate(D-aspartate) O-methyltransferase